MRYPRHMVLLLSLIASAHAAELPVPTAYATIQSAIDDAAPGDVVVIAAGTYEEWLSIDRDITLRIVGGRWSARQRALATALRPWLVAEVVPDPDEET